MPSTIHDFICVVHFSDKVEVVHEEAEADDEVPVEVDVGEADDVDVDRDDDNGGIVVLSESGSSSVHGRRAPSARGGRARGVRGRVSVRALGNRGRGFLHSRGDRRAVTRVTWTTPKGYDDDDVGNILPAFQPACEPGVHLDGAHALRNSMKTAADFLNLFFTVDMINSIVSHTNSYAYIHVAAGTHTTYTRPDGSWEPTTPAEICRLIAILIYFGLVSV